MWAAAETAPRRRAACSSRRAPTCARARRKGFTALHFAAREPATSPASRGCCAAGVDPEHPVAAGLAPRGRPRACGYQSTLSAGSTPLLVATVRGQSRSRCICSITAPIPTPATPGFTALHWAVGHVGRRRLESGLRLQRSDERHPQPPGQAAADAGAARARRESERAHDESARRSSAAATRTPPAPRRSCWPAPPPTSRS